jgi:hypothetical protein
MKNIFRNFGYALGIYVFFATLLITACTSKNQVKYDDLNRNINSTILKIEVDTLTNPYEYHFYIKKESGLYKELLVDPEWATIFKEGDRL